MHFQTRFATAAVLWTMAVLLALARTLYHVDGLTAWVTVTACSALMPSGWLIVDSVVQRCADEMMDALQAADEDVVERVAEKLADALSETHATPIRRN